MAWRVSGRRYLISHSYLAMEISDNTTKYKTELNKIMQLQKKLNYFDNIK